MTLKRKLALILAVFVAGIAILTVRAVQGSIPATPYEVRIAIGSVPPSCRNLARERVRMNLARSGAVSRRQLVTLMQQECTVAGPQYDATLAAGAVQ